MDKTKAKRIIILLIGTCLWTFYILQNELANYGIYSVVSYQIHEIASVIPMLCFCVSIIWFIKLLYTSIKKKSKDVLFAIVLLCILLLQGSYLYSMSKEWSTTCVVKIVSIDEAQNRLVVEQVESGKVIELESLMLVNNMVEPEGQTYLVTYSWNEKNPDKGKLRMIQTVLSSDIKTTLLDVMNIALPEGISAGEFDLYLEQGGGVPILNSNGDEVGIIGIHRITEGIFEQGNLVAAETHENHAVFTTEFERINSDVPGVIAGYSRDHGEHPDVWYAFWAKEGMEPVYAVCLYEQYFNYDEAMDFVENVIFSDEAFTPPAEDVNDDWGQQFTS